MYDEFGNYVGPELEDDDSDGAEGEEPDDVRSRSIVTDPTDTCSRDNT
jgi:hypothetical protein